MKYTVILNRPDYITNQEEDANIYVAFVKARDKQEAIDQALKEVFKADQADMLNPKDQNDYAFLLMFEGYQQPVLWGWQL